MSAQATWYEYLEPAECWKLLANVSVGRIGVIVDGAPEIYPINHLIDGESVVFRTDEGTKLHSIDHSPHVCFQADQTNEADATGWSVMVKGRAVELSSEEIVDVKQLNLQTWAVGHKAHWVRINPTEVTGRRIGRALDR